MEIASILQQLKSQRGRLSAAIAALEGSTAVTVRKAKPGRRSGGITPAGRKKLSQMMKKRWAERRKKAAK